MELTSRGAELQAGAAAPVITPPLDISMAGGYGDVRARGVLNDLRARALVLDDGTTTVAIAALDLCSIDPSVVLRAQRRAAELTGIPADRIMVTCTHTHSGPLTEPNAWATPDPIYLDVLARRIGDAVALAHQDRRPARLLVGHGHETSVAFNRRYWMRDGSLRTNPRFQDPAIVRPAGPLDPDVGILRVEDAATGACLALLVNYALHVAVVGGQRYSADFPGVLERHIRKIEGPETVVLFAPGCCGDINHWDMSKPGPQSGQPVAEGIGAVLAGETLKVTPRCVPIAVEGGIRYRRRQVDLPLRVPSAEERAWAEQRFPFPMREMDALGLESVAAYRMWWINRHGQPTVTVEVQALAIGDLAYVTLPAEIFVELGLAVKRQSPFPHTMIGMLNGSSVDYYVPTEKAYGEGGYEVTNSPLAPGSGETLVDTALELLHEVHA